MHDDTDSPPAPVPLEQQVAALIAIATGEAELFHCVHGSAGAVVTIAGRQVAMQVHGHSFRRWLIRRYWGEARGAPSPEAIKAALDVVDAIAALDAPERPGWFYSNGLGLVTFEPVAMKRFAG